MVLKLPKGMGAGLSALFLVAALGGGPPAMAATGKSKPQIPEPRTLKTTDLASLPPLSCVHRAVATDVRDWNYTTQPLMRRISAMAQARTLQGQDTEPVSAIALAAHTVGIDFDLMVMKAMIESRMGQYDQPLLGGSARGLFHFMPATWLTLFSWFGAEYNNGFYAEAAAQIKFDEGKDPYLDDPELKAKILALRSDPYIAAFIKAKEIRHDERPLLRAVLGREPTYTDYYVAHFLGLDRAKTFFRMLRTNPKAAAANIFVKESDDPNNRPLFYKGKNKLSVQQVYNHLDRVVSAVLSRVDRQITLEADKTSCVVPLAQIYPQREPIVVVPQNRAPEKLPESLPTEPGMAPSS